MSVMKDVRCQNIDCRYLEEYVKVGPNGYPPCGRCGSETAQDFGNFGVGIQIDYLSECSGGGKWFEHMADEPVYVGSRKQFKEACKANGVRLKDSDVPQRVDKKAKYFHD
jgi:hypothetical protein